MKSLFFRSLLLVGTLFCLLQKKKSFCHSESTPMSAATAIILVGKAARVGDIAALEEVIKEYPKVDLAQKFSYEPPLHLSAVNNHLHFVRKVNLLLLRI